MGTHYTERCGLMRIDVAGDDPELWQWLHVRLLQALEATIRTLFRQEISE